MNERYPAALDELMEFLRTLPGVGKRSAERMALQFLSWDEGRLEAFASALGSLKKKVGFCPVCGNLAPMEEETGKTALCRICASSSRDHTVLCVGEEFPQIRSIESSNVFRGVYHVLGGRIAPLEGKGLESITADALEKRLESGSFREIIFALSPDVEGQATALYLDKRFRRFQLRTSRLAQGLPAGSDLSYADPATVAAALSNRTSFDKDPEKGGGMCDV